MKKVVLVVIAAMLVTGLTGTVMAKPTHPTFGTFVNDSGVPAGSVLVLNIVHAVTNDLDSGVSGYWALSNYRKHIQVWQVTDESFYVVARYIGKWETFKGALSPMDGVVQSKDAWGTFQGGYTLTFASTGIINPLGLKTKGYVGSREYGGTKADVIAGTGPAPFPYSYFADYFPGLSSWNFVNWGWKYNYKNQTWNNFDYGNEGDIVT